MLNSKITRAASLSDDLASMLRDELNHIDDERRELDKRRQAVALLLGLDDAQEAQETPPVQPEAPDGTFAAPRKRRTIKTKLKPGQPANLTQADVEAIREAVESGKTKLALAHVYKVSPATVASICKRQGRFAREI